ncbi:hypothetical protein JL100_034410 (plasmid) [Skermanella mucosa]|uniref:hypothetical protein n=1 Tax=Skermanella mucosa TaxID=1789672 RepID=UPI00192B03B5|nr:hypothetical protein [Skermanella mucosa]UEM24835.1 hypothetical protein JL100_034410 [Skermanella mucosa]
MSALIALMLVVLLGWLLMTPLIIPPCWLLCRRWGYPPALSLWLVVPYIGFVALLVILLHPRPSAGSAGSG